MTDKNQDFVGEAMKRNPRTALMNTFTSGSFALESTRVVCRFESHSALADYLAQCMSVVYVFDEGETVAHQKVVAPALVRIREEELSEELQGIS